jgi:glycosyltransferase involved in cell wall biosynthesis
MKIAHLIEAGRFGGPNRTIIEVCKALKNEHEFIIISGSEDSAQFRSELDLIMVDSFFFPLTRLRFSFKVFVKYIVRFVYETILIYQTLKKEQVDVIHNHTYLDFKGVIVGRLLNKPVVWHLHSSILPNKIKPIFLLFLKIHKGNRVCVSKLTQDVFLGQSSNIKTSIIQSPVDTDLFSFKPKTAISNRLKKIISICCVANFHPEKGQKILVEAFSLLLKSMESSDLQFTLHLKGKIYKNQKGYVDELIRLVKKHKIEKYVFFDSNQNNKVTDFLQNKDIFVLASQAEASPISLWEAASMGIPLLCTDVGDVRYYIEKYNCGKILYHKSPENLRELILSLSLSDDFLKFSSNAREMVLKEFSSKRIKNKYLNVYNPLQQL